MNSHIGLCTKVRLEYAHDADAKILKRLDSTPTGSEGIGAQLKPCPVLPAPSLSVE